MTGRPPSTGLTAEQLAAAVDHLAEFGYVIVKKPDGDEVEAVAEALYARFPTADPLHLSSGVRWDELSETARRSYRGRAVGLISTLTAYREGQDG